MLQSIVTNGGIEVDYVRMLHLADEVRYCPRGIIELPVFPIKVFEHKILKCIERNVVRNRIKEVVEQMRGVVNDEIQTNKAWLKEFQEVFIPILIPESPTQALEARKEHPGGSVFHDCFEEVFFDVAGSIPGFRSDAKVLDHPCIVVEPCPICCLRWPTMERLLMSQKSGRHR